MSCQMSKNIDRFALVVLTLPSRTEAQYHIFIREESESLISHHWTNDDMKMYKNIDVFKDGHGLYCQNMWIKFSLSRDDSS